MRLLEDSRKHLEPALAYSGGTHAWEDIQEGVASGHMQLWADDAAAAITEIVRYPQKKVLNVFLAGGDMDVLLHMLGSAQAWGRAEGCDAMSMSGRRGWLRVLNKHGWEDAFSTMSCEL